MVNARAGSDRHSSSLGILMPILAGMLIGIAGFLVKMVMSKVSLNSGFISGVLYNPITYLAGVLGIVGFVIFQKSLYKGKISTITPVMNGLAILVPIVLAVLFLEESLSTIKIVGVALIVIGIAGLRG